MSETQSKGELAGQVVRTGSFLQRFFVYLFYYIVLLGFEIVIIVLGGRDLGLPENIPYYMQHIIVFGIPTIPFIIWEYFIRKFRKENGLPIYKNIEEDLIQMEIEQQIAREQKAYKKVTGSTDKNDINYWYDLFQKGAITKEEYQDKKRELL